MKYANKSMVTMIISALAAGAAFFLFYVMLDYALFISIAITVVLFIGLYLVLGPRKYQVGTIDLTDLANSGEMEELLDTGMRALEAIRVNAEQIDHAKMKTKLKHIHSLGLKIFQQIGKDPTQVKHIKRFFSYYLDVTLMLINKYKDLVQSNSMVQPNVNSSDSALKSVVEKLETSFELIDDAFTKQLNKLLAKDIMDIDVEMKVLESVLKEEG